MRTRKRRGAEGPREQPRDDPLPIGTLEAIARAEAMRCPGLAPNGGRRWTPEDIAFAVSLLVEITRTDAFQKGFPGGLDGRRSRGYLLSALHHELVRARRRDAWVILLDDMDLDGLPGQQGGADRLAPEDARGLARRFLAGSPVAETAELARRLRGEGPGSPASRRPKGDPPFATRVRLWARARAALLTLARKEDLSRGEMGNVLIAIADKMTGGGGRVWKNSGNCDFSRHSRYSLPIGARS